MGSGKGRLPHHGAVLPGRAAVNRRDLLRSALSAAGTLALGSAAVGQPSPPVLGRSSEVAGARRVDRAHALRLRAAALQLAVPEAQQAANGDEGRLAGYVACFSKSLPHSAEGLVDAAAYELLLAALMSEDPRAFEKVPLGGFVRLADPQAAFAFDLIGCDACQIPVAAAPSLDSAEQAGELVELYWSALLRDVPFADFATSAVAAEACSDLSRLSDFRGPREGGRITPGTLLRGSTPGDLVGPYLSQFLLKPIPYSPMLVDQRVRVPVPGLDYVGGYEEWLAIQNGALSDVNRFEPERRFLRTGRDLGEWVHRDFSYQAFLSAALILLKAGTPVDGGNPYKHSRTQGTFATFGPPLLLSLLGAVTQLALKACWYQKWLVHRRLRPEEMGGRAHLSQVDEAGDLFHTDLWRSRVVERLRGEGTLLLTQAYPEGSPIHPSYPSGHAAIAGACATLLKAFFDESYAVPQCVVASSDGLSLQPWEGLEMTVGGELDKLASNVSLGRNLAGIHWRSDATAGLELGEAIAIDFLRERKVIAGELFTGFSFRSFSGRRIVV